jgi:hypothetical protein
MTALIEQDQKRNDKFMGPIYEKLAKLEQHTLTSLTSPVLTTTQKSAERVQFWSHSYLYIHDIHYKYKTEPNITTMIRFQVRPDDAQQIARDTACTSSSHESRFLQDRPSEIWTDFHQGRNWPILFIFISRCKPESAARFKNIVKLNLLRWNGN